MINTSKSLPQQHHISVKLIVIVTILSQKIFYHQCIHTRLNKYIGDYKG